ncbi:MAG: SUMF1/EgtB/PvdO family nonheme iron enzyme [Pseudomonadota bacterium]
MEETSFQDPILPKIEGTVVANRYRILALIGMGGMGGVYKAYDQELNDTIAIKILRPELQMDPQSLQRFKLETKTTRKLRNPNIVGMFDLYWGEDRKFITMEWVDGITLKTLIKKHGVLPIPQTVDIAIQILRALEEAHRQGVIHRDIKPGNIMLIPAVITGDSPNFSVKVADFGIAKIVSGEAGVTTSGLIIGTPEYMSPEQAEGRSIGPQSDIYSLGIVLYEMLTGKVPFFGDTPMATLLKHLKDTPAALRDLCPKAPERLERLVMKMLAKRPEERWQTAGEIRELLEKRTSMFIATEAELIAHIPSETERFRRFEEAQGVTPKEKKRGKPITPKYVPGISRHETRRAFPWKSVAIASLVVVLLGIGLFAYKHDVISISRVPKDMTLIPEGEFIMGTSKESVERILEIFPDSKGGWLADEQPAHNVYLKAFYIDKHEVTNKEYKKFVDATGHMGPFVDEEWAKEYNWINNTYPPGKGDHPVVLVSWEDAQTYARWIGKRLPTEAEWEKAARGGLVDKLWPWGDEMDPERLNSWEGGANGTRPVGSYPPNQYGLYDMAGNVWEWCADGYSSYDDELNPSQNTRGPDQGVNKVVRGGSWSNMAFTSRCGERKKMNPTSQFNSIGFRCAKDK